MCVCVCLHVCVWASMRVFMGQLDLVFMPARECDKEQEGDNEKARGLHKTNEVECTM